MVFYEGPMKQRPVITTLLWAGFASLAGLAHSAGTEAVMVEIVDGDTSFLVDEKVNKAWWVVGECRRPIPMDNSSGKKSTSSKKKTNNSMISKVISNDVRMGSRQVELRQQFRFSMASTPVRVDVYNSVRGGWSQIDVRVNETCAIDVTCRRLAELPEC